MKPVEIEGWTIVLRHLHPNASGKIQTIETLQLSILKMKLQGAHIKKLNDKISTQTILRHASGSPVPIFISMYVLK